MIESLDYPPPTNEMSGGGQTAECFYLKCDQCIIPNCSCYCHTRRSNFYERIVKKEKESKPVMLEEQMKLLRGRGRPPRNKEE
jgi:hypothetical protein